MTGKWIQGAHSAGGTAKRRSNNRLHILRQIAPEKPEILERYEGGEFNCFLRRG
jgi:hypothetical protein